MTDAGVDAAVSLYQTSVEWTSLRDRVFRGSGKLDLLLFCAGPEFFALPLANVREALDGGDLFDLPDMPAHVGSMLSVSHRSIPLYKSQMLLGVDVTSSHPAVLIIKGCQLDAGLAVDSLVGTIAFDVSEIRQVAALEESSGAFVGVFFHEGQLFTLLDTTSFMKQGGEQP